MPSGQYERVKRHANWQVCHETQTKVCSACKRRKPFDGFYLCTKPTGHKYLGATCKECSRERARELNKTRVTTPEQHRARNEKARLRPNWADQMRRNARIRHGQKRAGGQASSPEVKAIYRQAVEEQALIQSCPVFDLPELGKRLHVDHIIPLSRGGQHVIGNLQILPAGINCRKHNKLPEEMRRV